MISRRRRTNIEIIADILKMPRIDMENTFFDCELNREQYERYLDHLISKGLLEPASNSQGEYQLTESGRELLRRIDRVQQLLSVKYCVKRTTSFPCFN